MDNLYGQAISLTHRLHYLMIDLQQKFDWRERGRKNDVGIDLTFQEDGIEATLWLAAEAWSSSKDLWESINKRQVPIDKAVQAVEGTDRHVAVTPMAMIPVTEPLEW